VASYGKLVKREEHVKRWMLEGGKVQKVSVLQENQPSIRLSFSPKQPSKKNSKKRGIYEGGRSHQSSACPGKHPGGSVTCNASPSGLGRKRSPVKTFKFGTWWSYSRKRNQRGRKEIRGKIATQGESSQKSLIDVLKGVKGSLTGTIRAKKCNVKSGKRSGRVGGKRFVPPLLQGGEKRGRDEEEGVFGRGWGRGTTTNSLL